MIIKMSLSFNLVRIPNIIFGVASLYNLFDIIPR
ncbi:unnamed protein product, partial [marine sediment metagenome]